MTQLHMRHATCNIHNSLFYSRERQTNCWRGWLAGWLTEAGTGRQALLLPPLADRAPELVGHHAAAVNI